MYARPVAKRDCLLLTTPLVVINNRSKCGLSGEYCYRIMCFLMRQQSSNMLDVKCVFVNIGVGMRLV